MARVLFITHDFPPDAMGVRRIVKFCKYLPDFKWEPLVLTVKTKQRYQLHDKSLDELRQRGVKIFRSGSADPYRVSHVLKKILPGGGTKKNSVPTQSTGLVKKIATRARRWLFIPDDRNLWIPFAVIKGLGIIKRERPDVIVTSSYPSSTHLVGLILHKLKKIPWVTDFRDGWLQNTVFYDPPTPLHHSIQSWLEKTVADNAALIVSVSEPITQYFYNITCLREKCITITNGFDEDDFDNVEPVSLQAGNTCVFLYTGTLFEPRTPRYLFDALKLLFDEKPHLRGKIRFVLFSVLSQKDLDYIKTAGLSDVVRIEPFTSYKKCVGYQKGADVLVLIIGPEEDTNIMMTQKVFEYLASERPILALTASGPCAALIKSLDAGRLVAPDDVAGIKDAIAELFADWCKGKLHGVSRMNIQQFSRRDIAERLAFALYKLLKEHRKNE